MAGIGIVVLWLGIIAVIILLLSGFGFLSLIISIFMKKSYKRKMSKYEESDKTPVTDTTPADNTNTKSVSKPHRYYLVPRVIAINCLLPLVTIVLCVALYSGFDAVRNKNSLEHNVESGNFGRVEELLESGVSPDVVKRLNLEPSRSEKTPFYEVSLAPGNDDVYGNNLSRSNSRRMSELLVENGADTEYRYYLNFFSYSVTEYLSSQSRNFQGYFEHELYGVTVLLHNIVYADLDQIEFLVELGANPHATDILEYNAFHYIAFYLDDSNGIDLLEYFYEIGVDINAETIHGQTPLEVAQNNARTNNVDNDEIIEFLEEHME